MVDRWLAFVEREVAAERERLTQAERDVIAERRRQVSAEGWTPEHDDEHTRGELAIAAAHLATAGSDATVEDPHGVEDWNCVVRARSRPDLRRDAVQAGALILAEIERLDRADALLAARSRKENQQ
jgi:hypothetical protein